jgi:putative membrane protein
MRASIVSATAVVLGLIVGTAFGEGGGYKMGGGDPATFVEKAALDGMTEVELGKIAQQNAESKDVKAFGARMVKDHSKANAELKSIAQSRGLQVPAKLDEEHQAMVDKFSAMSGAQFDAAYAKNMSEDHAKAIALFKEASEGSDPQLAGFAQKTLPTLKEHKAMADKLVTSTGAASAAGA